MENNLRDAEIKVKLEEIIELIDSENFLDVTKLTFSKKIALQLIEYLAEDNIDVAEEVGKVTINATCVLTLISKNDWVWSVPDKLPAKRYNGEKFLFIDSHGNYLHQGEDFNAATELRSYPVNVYAPVRAIEKAIKKCKKEN